MPPRSQTRPPHLPYVVSAFGACEKIRRLNAELAEHAEKSPKHFFSAASAASALNVICSQTLKPDTTYTDVSVRLSRTLLLRALKEIRHARILGGSRGKKRSDDVQEVHRPRAR